MISKLVSKLCEPLATIWRRHAGQTEAEKGQSLIVLAFAFLALIAMLGIALDLGLVYVERVRLKRSIDAAVLSGVVELPFEEDAANRAIEYLRLNGYDMDNAQIIMRGCVRDVNDYYTAGGALCSSNPTPGCAGDGDTTMVVNAGLDPAHPPYTYTNPASPTSVFYVNTFDYQGTDHAAACKNTSPKAYGRANKLEITGTIKVGMNFMQFFGFGDVPVTDNAIAQNVDNLDVVVVLDRSGSMEYDPVCLGCWDRTATPKVSDVPPYSNYYTYPSNGQDYTVPYTSTYVKSACYGENAYNTTTPSQPYWRTYSTYKYMIIEAEMYSENNSTPETAFRETGKDYWAMQRGKRNYPYEFVNDGNSTSVVVDGRALYMSNQPDITYNMPGYHPFGQFYTASDAADGNAPRLTYDITFPTGWGTSTSYLWVKTSTSDTVGTSSQLDLDHNTNRSTFYWQLQDMTDGTATAITTDTQTNTGLRNWTWLRLGSLNPAHSYRFNMWAGSSGIGLDRLIVTTNSSSSGNDTSCSSSGNTIYPASGYNMGTAAVTADSAHRAACDPCNPMYGNVVGPSTSYPTCTFFTQPVTTTDMLVASPIWRDSEAPLRSAKEAIKGFVQRLDPKYDQVGLVTYNDSSFIKTNMECLIQHPSTCLAGSNPISFTTVLKAVEDADAQSGTYTSSGMKAGLEVLGLDPYSTGSASSYGRGGAASKVMILLTDGVPYPPASAYPAGLCTSDWYPYSGAPNAVSTAYQGDTSSDCSGANCDGNDCMLWFSEYARANGVIIFVIGLGYGVNGDLLEETAKRTGGSYYFSASGADLDLIFDEILQNIYVRLIR